MAPGLRPVGSKGDVGRRGLGRIAGQCAGPRLGLISDPVGDAAGGPVDHSRRAARQAAGVVSVLTLPAGVTMSVSGVSAETDQALPHGPRIGVAYLRNADHPGEAGGPPKSSVSGLASGSEKFELACPARKPPSVP